jgi:pyruvate dehydrogenase E2 component (dihydrolipoamide acetyltransferase)
MDTFIREFDNVDISVAVSTDAGLITPIVFDAGTSIYQHVCLVLEIADESLLQT